MHCPPRLSAIEQGSAGMCRDSRRKRSRCSFDGSDSAIAKGGSFESRQCRSVYQSRFSFFLRCFRRVESHSSLFHCISSKSIGSIRSGIGDIYPDTRVEEKEKRQGGIQPKEAARDIPPCRCEAKADVQSQRRGGRSLRVEGHTLMVGLQELSSRNIIRRERHCNFLFSTFSSPTPLPL